MNKLYDIFCKNLQSIKKHHVDEYMCPICLSTFTKKDLSESESDHNFLTREHVPPKSVGGVISCLTCKKCNSESGYKFEYSIESIIDSIEFNRKFVKGENINCRVKINSKISANLKIEDDKYIFDIISKNSQGLGSPNSIKELIQELKNGKSNLKIGNHKSKNFTENKISISLLKSAYLYFFSIFGYYPIFTPPFSKIRKQIINNDEDLINSFLFSINYQFEDNFLGISYIIRNDSIYGYLIVFQINGKNINVVLPSLNDDDFLKYKDVFKGGEFTYEKINGSENVKQGNYLTNPFFLS